MSGERNLLSGTPMPGPHKYLGGAVTADGKYLFGVPSNAERVLRLDLTTGDITYHGTPRKGKFKWLRGVLDKKSGAIYCIPACADCVLRIDPKTCEVTELGKGTLPKGEWKWHGGAMGLDGNIYAMPANALRVLKIEPDSGKVYMIGPELHPGLKNKWYGGIRAEDGAIWGMPYNAPTVLKIDPSKGEGEGAVTEIGDFGNLGGWKWHGGSRSGGYIIAVPSHAPKVLRIETAIDKVELIGPDLGGGRYKCGGAATDGNGIVWGIPSDIDTLLRIDPITATVTKFGPKLSPWKNKWQGAAVRGTDVYCIPCDAMRVLVLHTASDKVSLLGGNTLPLQPQKFQGAALASDGTIWGLPENCDGILRIPPGFGEDGGDDNVEAGDEEWKLWKRTWEESRGKRTTSAGTTTALPFSWKRWVEKLWKGWIDNLRDLIRSNSLTRRIMAESE